MQRRAAAAYLALFLVVSAGAYAVIGVAEKPHVSLDAPQYEPGDQLTVDGRTYAVEAITKETSGGGGGHGGGGGGTTITGTLNWTDPDATYTASMENNTTVSWQTVSWDGQDVQRVTLSAGDTLQYGGSLHEVVLNASASPATMRLRKVTNASSNVTFAVGDTLSLTYDGQRILGATLTAVSDGEATLTWGDDYRVVIPNETDPDTARLVQEFNVTRRLMLDPAAFNETVVVNGVESVAFRNDSVQPLEAYLPEPEVHELSEGDTLAFDGNETTVGNISAAAVPLSWTDARTYTVELSEGSTVTLNGRTYFAHFPSASAVQVFPNDSDARQSYADTQQTIDVYDERMSGLWAVTILSLIAAFILALGAYIPVKD